MCGTVKFEGMSRIRGQKIVVFNRHSMQEATLEWSGFARQENLDWWMRQGDAIELGVKVHSFTEGEHEFQVEGTMKGIGIRKTVRSPDGRIIAPRGSVKIVTRPPKNQDEKSIHSRWPVVEKKDGDVQQFRLVKTPKQQFLFDKLDEDLDF